MWPNCLTPQLFASWYSARILFFLALWYSYVFRSSLIILLAPCTLPGSSYYARILFFPGPWYFYSDHGLYDFVFFQRIFVYFSHKIIICRFDYYFYTQLSLFLKLTSAQAIVEKFFVQGNNDISECSCRGSNPWPFNYKWNALTTQPHRFSLGRLMTTYFLQSMRCAPLSFFGLSNIFSNVVLHSFILFWEIVVVKSQYE